MEWLLILLFVVLTIVIYLLFAPFYLEIDSIKDLFRVRFHRLAAARLVIKERSVKVELIIAGWKREFDPFSRALYKSKPHPAIKKRRKSSISLPLIKAMVKSFKINSCYLSIDTGDMPLNGILYPGFYWLSRLTGKTFEINFSDKNELILEIKNNIARIIRVFIFHSYINKKK